MFGASLGEIALVALLVGFVLLAPIAPKIGAAIGGLFEKPSPDAAPKAPEAEDGEEPEERGDEDD
jgi:hypothetical protein